MATSVFCSVRNCTHTKKQNLIPFFKLQSKIKGKGKIRKALKSPPLRRIQSHQETVHKKSILTELRDTSSSD